MASEFDFKADEPSRKRAVEKSVAEEMGISPKWFYFAGVAVLAAACLFGLYFYLEEAGAFRGPTIIILKPR